MLEYKVGADMDRDTRLVKGLLRAGLSYVTTANRGIIVLLGHRRAALPLQVSLGGLEQMQRV
jgi:hypothetical protein